MPKISVIMSVYNGEKYLSEAIESILVQTLTDFEFIIVDDGSSDTSCKIIEEYQKKDNRIILIRNEKNLGLTKSLNKAIKIAKGDYIARMDADDFSLKDRLEKQLEEIGKDSKIGVVGSNVEIIDFKGKKIKDVFIENLNEKIFNRNCLVHGSLFFDKKIFTEVGLYNEDFRYAQDYEFLLRIRKKFDLVNISEILYKLRFSSNRLSTKKVFAQIYFTSLAKFNFKKENRGIIYKKIGLVWENIYTFIFIYKLGLGELLRKFKIIS